MKVEIFARWVGVNVRGGLAASLLGFAVVGSSVNCTADPLDQWVARTWPVPVKLFDVIYAGGQFVAVGRETNGTAVPLIASSVDGSNWVRRTSNARATLRGITYGNGLYVAVGTPDLTSALP